MNIWIASSFSPPVWLWFKTAITPMMVIAYSVIQFYIWNKHEQIK
jgi:intracellular septation protein A